MMGIGAEDAKRLSYYEFTGRRWIWNERHRPEGDDGDPVQAPDAEFVAEHSAMLEARGIARSIH